jgi:hypothetical protein
MLDDLFSAKNREPFSRWEWWRKILGLLMFLAAMAIYVFAIKSLMAISPGWIISLFAVCLAGLGAGYSWQDRSHIQAAVLLFFGSLWAWYLYFPYLLPVFIAALPIGWFGTKWWRRRDLEGLMAGGIDHELHDGPAEGDLTELSGILRNALGQRRLRESARRNHSPGRTPVEDVPEVEHLPPSRLPRRPG